MTAASASVPRCPPRRASAPGSSAGRRKGWKTISTRPRRGSLWPRGQTLLPPRTVTGRIGTSASRARRAAPPLKRARPLGEYHHGPARAQPVQRAAVGGRAAAVERERPRAEQFQRAPHYRPLERLVPARIAEGDAA